MITPKEDRIINPVMIFNLKEAVSHYALYSYIVSALPMQFTYRTQSCLATFQSVFFGSASHLSDI